MIVYAFDDSQEMKTLEKVLKQIIGKELIFQGFTSSDALLREAEQITYDVTFVNVENNAGMLLLGELHRLYPYSNFIGVAVTESIGTALILHRIHASGYIIKPYNTKHLADSLKYLRFPVQAEKLQTVISS